MGEDSLPGMSVPVGREGTPLRNPWMVGEMTDSGAGAEQVAAEPEHCVPQSKKVLPQNKRTCHKVTEVKWKGLPLMKSEAILAKDADLESNARISNPNRVIFNRITGLSS